MLARTLEQVETLATLGILEHPVPVALAVVAVLLLEAHLEPVAVVAVVAVLLLEAHLEPLLELVVVEVLPLEAHQEFLLSFHQEEEELLPLSH
jgi:hypothetical protein